MEAKNLYVLSGTENLMRGELDNVTIQDGRLRLDSVAGRYVLYGCYTSQPVSFPAFTRLIMSWNADTPNGTVVEAQARVMVDGNWTTWSSFGRWSPFLTTRANAKRPPRGPVSVEGNILNLDGKTAMQAQMRIYLYTEDERISPAVDLLAMSVHTFAFTTRAPASRPMQRELRVPAYSQLLRDPLFGGRISLPVCLTGLMNRWGEDVLPEELAHAMYDWADRTCANLTFGTAAAGCWGYECYALWCDLPHLREEVRSGFAAAVRLSYPGQMPVPPAVAECGEAAGHYVNVTGFVTRDGVDYVLVNDPLAPTDDSAPRAWHLSYFMDVWDGLTLLLHRRRKTGGWQKPGRVTVSLQPVPDSNGLYRLCGVDGPLELSADFCGSEGVPRGCVGIIRNGKKVFATTAHKRTRFVLPMQGCVQLPPPSTPPVRYTVFAVNSTGRMTVGEVHR